MTINHLGIVSYNIYCNFTNYGSALQSWALFQTVNKLAPDRYKSILVDYCPDILADKDPLDPMKNMWDKDSESRKQCELSLPAIRINYEKFDRFYNTKFDKTSKKYTSANFDSIVSKEKLDGFICGSDTIFCIDEFGFDDGYYANYNCMRQKSVSYAASFGDPHFTEETLKTLNERLNNFKALGIRENSMIPYVKDHTEAPVQKVLDPTLLLERSDYDTIASPKQHEKPYLLLYARRHNPKMTEYAEKLAIEKGLEIVEISLRAEKAERHRMFYEAGVEEFLSLVKYADYIVTNSFHGMIFSVIYQRPFIIFSREQCDNKIAELLELFGINDRLFVSGNEPEPKTIDFKQVKKNIEIEKVKSIDFLKQTIDLLLC